MGELDFISRIPRRIEFDDGIRRAFTPSLILGCLMWLRADMGITKDGSNKVSAWGNGAGGAVTVAQGTGAAQPTWIASSTNGQPAVRGIATTALVVSGMVVSGAATYVMAITKASLASSYLWSGTTDNTGFIENFVGSKIEWFNSPDRQTLSLTPAAGAHVVALSQLDATSCIGYIDGVQSFSVVPTVAAQPVTRLLNASTLTNGPDSDLLEVAVYSRQLQLAEINRITKYMGSRYAIAVSG